MCLRIQSRISGDYIGNSGVAQLTMLVLLVLCLALPATVPTQVRAEDGPVIELPDVSDDTMRIPTYPDSDSNDIRTVIPEYPDKLTRRR